MSPSTAIYVSSPAFFNITLNVSEVLVTLLQLLWIQQFLNNQY